MNQTFIAAEYILSKINSAKPKIGLILGSGLGTIAESLEDRKTLPYSEIPSFPKLGVKGHTAQLSYGLVNNTAVVCLEGRVHWYEGAESSLIKHYIRTLKLIGCEILVITNASGSLRKEVGPGSIVLINDHINFQGLNPLVGINEEEFGPRFFPMDNVYDAKSRNEFHECANQINLTLHDGVYMAVTGPNYETPAEIRAFTTLGADVVGMSTVPEVLVAAHCGLKVVGLATITNWATGLVEESHSHDKVVNVAQQTARQVKDLILTWIKHREAK